GLTLITAAALGRLGYLRDLVDRHADLLPHRRRGAPATPSADWPSDTAHLRGDVLSDALYAAARNGHTTVVEYLADHGADINARGFFGATGLHWAAINGHRQTVAWLMARGAALDLRDGRFGATAEGWAREAGHHQIAVMLSRDGVDS
ncbi:MAG: ankyrin repeat domain-containing protein, partial [Gemmatimonadales bacterium]